jgi:O-antigen ligase
VSTGQASLAVSLRQPSERAERSVLIGVILGELALLAAGFATGHPFLAAGVAAAFAFFLVSYRFPDLAWALVWISVAPSVEVLFPGGIAVTMPTEPMIALALLGWLFRRGVERRWSFPGSPLHKPLAVLASVTLLSALWSVRPSSTLKAWVMMAGYVAFGYLYFAQGRCDSRRRDRWILMISLTGAGWALFGLARVFLSGHPESALKVTSTYTYGVFRPFFHEHGTYAAYLCMLLPVPLLASMVRRGLSRLLYGVCAFLVAIAIVLAFARAGWVALLLVVPAALVGWARASLGMRRLVLPAAIAIGVIWLVATVGIGNQIAKHAGTVVSAENMSNLERLNRWTAAVAMLREHPLTGVGFGCYVDAYPSYKRRAVGTEQSTIRMGVHSEPLKLLSETGLPGFLAACWLFGTLGWVGVRAIGRASDPSDRMIGIAALAGFSTYVVNGFFNAYLVEEKVTIPFWMAMGVIAALDRANRRDSPDS